MSFRRGCSASTGRSRRLSACESPEGLPVDDRHPAGHRRAALGSRSPRDLRRRVAARADRHRRPTRTPRSTPRSPTPSRSPSSWSSRTFRPSSARCSCCATCSTTRTTESLRSSGKSERPRRARSPPARAGVWTSADRATRRPSAVATSWRSAFLPRPARAIWRRSNRCLAEDVALHGDGGGRVPALARALYGRRRVTQAIASWLRIGQSLRRASSSASPTSTACPAR